MQSLSLTLDDQQFNRLDERARELGLSIEELLRRSIDNLLSLKQQVSFAEVAKRVVAKNEELYRRLAQ